MFNALEFALSVPDIGLYHDAEIFVEVWMQRDNISVSEVIIVDELNLLENSDVSVMVSETSCTGEETQCLLVEMQYSYREPPIYNAMAVKPVNWDDNARQFYFNDGIHVDGESKNPQKEIDISPSHAINIAHTDVTLHLVQIDTGQSTCGWISMGDRIGSVKSQYSEYIISEDELLIRAYCTAQTATIQNFHQSCMQNRSERRVPIHTLKTGFTTMAL